MNDDLPKFGTSIRDVIDKTPSELPKPKLDKVDVPDLPEIKVEVSTWEKLMTVFTGVLNTLVKKAANGEAIELPSFALPSNIKLIAGIVVILLLLVAFLRTC